MLIELSSWLFIYTFKQWKWFVIGASCFRVRVLCAVISVKSLSTKFIWTTEKLSDWWFKIFVMRWYYWRSKRQRESWVGDKFVLSTKLISFLTVSVAVDMHLIGWVEVAIPRIVRVGVQHGDQKISINRQSS